MIKDKKIILSVKKNSVNNFLKIKFNKKFNLFLILFIFIFALSVHNLLHNHSVIEEKADCPVYSFVITLSSLVFRINYSEPNAIVFFVLFYLIVKVFIIFKQILKYSFDNRSPPQFVFAK